MYLLFVVLILFTCLQAVASIGAAKRYLVTITIALSTLSVLLSILLLCAFLFSPTVSLFATFTPAMNMFSFFGLSPDFGFDAFSIWFIPLTSFLIFICYLLSLHTVKYNLRTYVLLFALLQLSLILTFSSLNLFLFYLFFEISLVPMFLIIGIWGTRQRKIHAAYLFFFYTIAGSICLVAGLLLLLSYAGTLNFPKLMLLGLNPQFGGLIWILFFLGFAVKVPMVPFHIWLPEAHVEAPTAGSVILAGILLKIGTLGLVRFLLPLQDLSGEFFSPIALSLAIFGTIYASFIALRQVDIKKLIAYSSVAHMGYVILGIFSDNLYGLVGAVYLMLTHAVISSALFIGVGVLYDRYQTKSIYYYSGLATFMPLFSIFLFLFLLANLSFPSTSNFVGELFVMFGLVQTNLFLTILALIPIALTATYSFWLFSRICFNSVEQRPVHKEEEEFEDLKDPGYVDLTPKEFAIFLSLFLINLLLGLKPALVFEVVEFYLGLLYIIN